MENSKNILYYDGAEINLGNLSQNFVKQNLNSILNKEILEKYLDENDYKKLSKFLPEFENKNNMKIKNILSDIIQPNNSSNYSKFSSPINIFQNMLGSNYFTENFQNNMERLKMEGLEEYINNYEKIYKVLKNRYKKSLLNINKNKEDVSDEENNQPLNNLDINNFEIESNSFIASSGYTTLNSEEEKELETEERNENSGELNGSIAGKPEGTEGEEGLMSNERFKNLKINKNQLTIRPRSKEEIKDFHKQEIERYKNGHLPWTYFNADGSTSIVAPVLKKPPTNSTSKPRDHVMLKPDRPSYVTILCLARDAASRLPDGVGSRADICDLLKDSQFINERLSDSQINNIVSGALDRLHYEKDPCVKYDLQKKLWIYLHKNRPTDYPPWNEHMKKNDNGKSELVVDNKDIELKSDDKGDQINNIPNEINEIKTKPQSLKRKKGCDKMLKHKRKHSSQ